MSAPALRALIGDGATIDVIARADNPIRFCRTNRLAPE
jgi:hypothetical protein